MRGDLILKYRRKLKMLWIKLTKILILIWKIIMVIIHLEISPIKLKERPKFLIPMLPRIRNGILIPTNMDLGMVYAGSLQNVVSNTVGYRRL